MNRQNRRAAEKKGKAGRPPGPSPQERTIGAAPDFQTGKPLPLLELPAPGPLAARLLVPNVNDYLRTYRLGYCHAIVTREYGDWHLSLSHQCRLPSWYEVTQAWYRLVPEAGKICGAMILPPVDEYINIHSFCLQMVQIPNPDQHQEHKRVHVQG